MLNVHLCSPPLDGVGDERAGDIYLSHEERIAGSQTSGAAAGDKMIFGLGSGSISIAESLQLYSVCLPGHFCPNIILYLSGLAFVDFILFVH